MSVLKKMHLQAMGLSIDLQTVQCLNITVLSAVNSTVSDSYSGLNASLKYEVEIFIYLTVSNLQMIKASSQSTIFISQTH